MADNYIVDVELILQLLLNIKYKFDDILKKIQL